MTLATSGEYITDEWCRHCHAVTEHSVWDFRDSEGITREARCHACLRWSV